MSKHESRFSLFSKSALSLAIAVLATAPAFAQSTDTKDEAQPRAKEDSVRLGTITIVGEGNKLGAGLMLNEDTVKVSQHHHQGFDRKRPGQRQPFPSPGPAARHQHLQP